MIGITEGVKQQFAKSLDLIAGETSKLLKYVEVDTQETEVSFFDTVMQHEADEVDRRPIPAQGEMFGISGLGHYGYGTKENEGLTDTRFHYTDIRRRQLTCRKYTWTEILDRGDKLNLIGDPTSKYPKAAGFAMARAKDRAIIKAVGSTVGGGYDGKVPLFFDLNNVISTGPDGPSSFDVRGEEGIHLRSFQFKNNLREGGLTVGKLLKAKDYLERGTGNAGKKMYFVCGQAQIQDLLREEYIINQNYAGGHGASALATGAVTHFMGFEFIITELLGGLTSEDKAGADETKAVSIKECFAFAEGSIKFSGVQGSKITEAVKLPNKNFAHMLFHSEHFGAARLNEGGVVIVKCLEQALDSHTDKRGWVYATPALGGPGSNPLRVGLALTIPAHSWDWHEGMEPGENGEGKGNYLKHGPAILEHFLKGDLEKSLKKLLEKDQADLLLSSVNQKKEELKI
ncbi:MAG: hypothetical protein GY858_06355 [Candidatus Omnitrophica bacterium]|nr:hypothetical protein [Candidatus Omnitrophota bacterium]